MLHQIIFIQGNRLNYYECNTVIVGSGAAGFAAADRLYEAGQKNLLLVTEGLNMGTSRNTGSDKQTYYKYTFCGDQADSLEAMTRTYFEGESMDGDLALCEAANSARSFFYLCEAGVQFPFNTYGEYTGYKTDHDPAWRATSVGPLTSKAMVECLEQRARSYKIPILDGVQVVRILRTKTACCGVLGLVRATGAWVVINATNVVYATGGPAGIYKTSVYPPSQIGSTGTALAAGITAKNLTEWQYGLASIGFRWNVSGSYQQAMPRYISTAEDGSDVREFLCDAPGGFADAHQMLAAQFHKGNQWPFDPRKTNAGGSSNLDILVYREINEKHRRVWLDFRYDPTRLTVDGPYAFAELDPQSYSHLENAGALIPTPIARLEKLNPGAIELYNSHGIDLYTQPLEIAVCAQHNNGGLAGDMWWESNLPHFFPIGEVNGSHGVYRPGGSALNSGQVGALRASIRITRAYQQAPMPQHEFIEAVTPALAEEFTFTYKLLTNKNNDTTMLRDEIATLMSETCAHIRSREKAAKAIARLETLEQTFEVQAGVDSPAQLAVIYRTRDLLLTARALAQSILAYIEAGGGSRGSYLIEGAELDNGKSAGRVLETRYKNGSIHCSWRPVRPIPIREQWFDTMWRDFRDAISPQP